MKFYNTKNFMNNNRIIPNLDGIILKIQIIGLGVVGAAQADLMHTLGHKVIGYDPYNHPAFIQEKVTFVETPITDADITFICVPETIVEDIVQMLVEKKSQGLIVTKSTVPIGTTRKLSEKHSIHISNNPEFLREEHVIYDVYNPGRILIGECCPTHGKLLSSLYESLHIETFIASQTETETIKIVSNTLKAYMITFWNNINELCETLDISTKNVSNLLNPEKTLYVWGDWGGGAKFFGKPYSGKCLPKDLKQLINILQENNVDSTIFTTIQEYNNRIKTT